MAHASRAEKQAGCCSAGAHADVVGPNASPPVPEDTIYTCPMHPQIRQVGPGFCPICGMALEPELVSAEAAPNPELADMTRRFVVALLLPGLFPPAFRSPDGAVAVYFEAAAVITILVLLGQVLELRAREQTSGAIRALL